MTEPKTTRRGLLRAGGTAACGAVVGGAAVSATGTASAQSDYGGWLSNVSNYDGTVVDRRGQDSVTIEVGAEGNGGPYAFEPPAVKVNPGTTIVWEWVAGNHNVVDDAGAFESEYTGETGHTFEYTPEETGVIKYFCSPHKTMGMKGVLDVVEGESSGGSSGESADAGPGENTRAMGSDGDGGVGGLVVTGLALAFLSPALFATFLRNRDLDERPDGPER